MMRALTSTLRALAAPIILFLCALTLTQWPKETQVWESDVQRALTLTQWPKETQIWESDVQQQTSETHNRLHVPPVCNTLEKLTPLEFWNQQLNRTVEALGHSPANKTDFMTRMAWQVLHTLPTSKLQESLSTPSIDPHKMKGLISLTEQGKTIQVLVFGGSPTVGSNCERDGRAKKQGQCAWPGHLQEFVNAWLGYEAINVVNYGIGASSSEVASMMLRYRLFPASMMPEGPDVIINAYAVNDFSYHSTSNNFGKFFEDFVASVRSLTSCDYTRPVVLYLDDFMNTYDRSQSLSQAQSYTAEIQKYTSWYQIPLIAYARMMHPWVYQDTPEAKLLVDRQGDSKHMTWAGHVAVVMTLAYRMLHEVHAYCQDTLLQPHIDTNAPSVLDSIHRPLLGKAKANTVASVWKQNQDDWNCNATSSSCDFAWVALRREREMYHLPQITDIMGEAHGWEYRTKWPPSNYGLYSNGVNSTLWLRVNSTAANTVGFFYMKSYSEKWKDANVQVTVHLGNQSNPVTTTTLSGYHDKSTSEFFPASLQFDHSIKEEVVYAELRQIGGGTFRISAVSFCTQ